jgi:hypothetical protein
LGLVGAASLPAADGEGEIASALEAGVGQLGGTDNGPSEIDLPGPADATSMLEKSYNDGGTEGFG